MKIFFKLILLTILPSIGIGQKYSYYHIPDRREYDSLEKVLSTEISDTERMYAYRQCSFYLFDIKRDSAFYFANSDLDLARKIGLKLWEADGLDGTAYGLWRLGNYPGALQRFLEGIKIADDPASEKRDWGIEIFTANKNPRTARMIILAQLHFDLATLYEEAGYSEKGLAELVKGEEIAKGNADKSALSQIYEGFGRCYLSRHRADTALNFLQKSIVYSEQSGWKIVEGDCYNLVGDAYLALGDYQSAKINFFKSIQVHTEQNSQAGLTHNYLSLADLYLKQNNYDSGLYYAKKGLVLTAITHDLSDVALVYNSLSSIFQQKNNIDSAFKYQGLAVAAKDSLNNGEKVKQFENIGFAEQMRLQQVEEEKAAFVTKIRTYIMLAGLGVVLLIALILFRNNRQKQKTNKVLETTLSNLKSTQAQLIQSEKMASLGELTAGIAHEIQNPLNFVNNFSEVNKELLVEMNDEIEKGNYTEVKSIAKDVTKNEDKIIHHGKRADAIVKGMLQHSQKSTGQREPANINALANEYLRLSYNGLRAKDKEFNAEIKTDFDQNIGNINIIPQDIGRVLLNLYSNAFYAVSEKKKQQPEGYEPVVSVSTKRINDKVEITIKDNGIGIPQKVIDKIFQPFFTTKPTGVGTGLGLSLSYDIIKAHGGEIKVESKDGEGSEFVISLPASQS